jgi:hypothetical protein
MQIAEAERHLLLRYLRGIRYRSWSGSLRKEDFNRSYTKSLVWYYCPVHNPYAAAWRDSEDEAGRNSSRKRESANGSQSARHNG